MPLPSQSRSFGSRSTRKRRKKGPPPAVFIVPAALIGLVGLWWAFGGGNTGANAGATDDGSADQALASVTRETLVDPVITEPIIEEDPAPPPVQTPPTAITRLEPTGETVMLGNQPARAEQQSPPPVTLPRPSLTAIKPKQDLPAEDPGEAQPGTAGAAPGGAMDRASAHLARGELVTARAVLNDALRASASATEQQRLREELTTINQELFFGTKVYPGDTIAELYEVQAGDSLARITTRLGLAVDWRLIQRINRISDPSRIRVGQKLKLVRGPVHAVVTKSDYRIDLFVGPPGAESQWTYLRSFRVGLGELDSTPLGEFVVRTDSKLINPVWRNPRTGEFFGADDPKNPIGERWVGIEGVGASAGLEGYGIHGTIDPSSIGHDASMGCVRVGDGDVDLIYEMLEEQVSQVLIRP